MTPEQGEAIILQGAAIIANQVLLLAWLDWFKTSLPGIVCGSAFAVTVMFSAFLGITRAFGRRGL